MDIQDKILSAVLDIQSDVKELKNRVDTLESNQQQIIQQNDALTQSLKRHDEEITSSIHRVDRLETKLA